MRQANKRTPENAEKIVPGYSQSHHSAEEKIRIML